MGVIMQAFYWDCPRLEGKQFNWWKFVETKLASLSTTGFTALWLPPACKAANLGGMSMGYDPYDYYDLGDIDQKGSIPTWFGSYKDLKSLIGHAHKMEIQLYADLVLNHTNGADEEEINPMTGVNRWTKYKPKSGKFPRDWTCYHPSYFERMDDEDFEGMPDLCHRNPYVYSELMEYARWLIEDVGFDGLRYDFVKGYGTWIITAILERLYSRDKNKTHFSPFGVGEYWDSDSSIAEWLEQTNAFSDNPVSAFDFPLRYRLQSLCDTPGFSLKTLSQSGTLLTDGLAKSAVTFVENHDIIRSSPIVNDKMLAYGFILTHEGYPCVFWEDYYNFNLAAEGCETGIWALVKLHESHAGGSTSILCSDNDNLYIMQRNGFNKQAGLIFVLNNGSGNYGKTVKTKWMNQTMTPVAWWGHSNGNIPAKTQTDTEGNGNFWAPSRGYVVYIPTDV